MSLATGTRLGPYEVLGLLGAGGMGEVYRARDTRLDRSVAIKVLPADLAADADPSASAGSARGSARDERRARFEREARTISTLNHPHICALYDVGDHDGVPYLVMEHLAGETLANRLAKGPLPLEQALDLGAQIADALSAAHRHGIVHRDLKPANVMLTKTGAKLLDFGLAKLTGHGEQPAVVLEGPSVTRTGSLTGRGMILGTLAYMSPEQVQGKEPDTRSDIFSFGAMFYEMLTGEEAFGGENPASVIAAILDREPAPVTTVEPTIPPALGLIVTACLAKEPDERVQSAHDLLLDLRRLRDTASQTMVVPAVSRRPRWRRVLVPALWFLAGAAVAAGLVSLTRAPRVVPREVVRFTIDVPESRDLGAIALSPDGRRLAYVGTEEGADPDIRPRLRPIGRLACSGDRRSLLALLLP